jgi:hypothetical protein
MAWRKCLFATWSSDPDFARLCALEARYACPAMVRAVPKIQFRLRIVLGDNIAIGPGKVDLLEAIGATGSITAAARTLGMSYRRAWLLVDTMNRCFAAALVALLKSVSEV